jgi:hypothetical protein
MNGSGIVSCAYLMAPNGVSYKNFFCKDWKVVIDSQMPVENFRSHEKWSLFAMDGEKVLAIIPGCRVDGCIACETCPIDTDCFMDSNGNYNTTKRGIYDLTAGRAYPSK